MNSHMAPYHSKQKYMQKKQALRNLELEALGNADAIRKQRRYELRETLESQDFKKKIVLIAIVVLLIITVIFAMHGDQEALANGYIH